jgi:hypothetical protein
MDRNDCHTAWGNFKTLIYFLHQYKYYACWFSLIVKKKMLSLFSLLLCIAIYRLQVTTFLTLAGVAYFFAPFHRILISRPRGGSNNFFYCRFRHFKACKTILPLRGTPKKWTIKKFWFISQKRYVVNCQVLVRWTAASNWPVTFVTLSHRSLLRLRARD